jgi:hypothetical protein
LQATFLPTRPPGEVETFTRRCSSSSSFLGALCMRVARCAGPHIFLELHWRSGQWCCSTLCGARDPRLRCGAIGERALRKLQCMWCAVDPCTTLRFVHPTDIGHGCARGAGAYRNVTSHVHACGTQQGNELPMRDVPRFSMAPSGRAALSTASTARSCVWSESGLLY